MAQIKLNATYGLTGTLPAVSGVNLTALNGTQVTSGTVADARISALTSSKLTGNLPALNGSALTALNASNVGSGTLAAARFSGGKIGQVVFNQGTVSSNHITTTSTSFVGTGINQGITCSATSSKVLIEVYSGMFASNTDDDVRLAIYRTSPSSATNLSNSTYGAGQFRIEAGSGGTNYSSGTFSFIHAPSSTTTQIYEIYMRSGGGASAYFCQVNGMYRLTCKEILA